MIKYKASQRRVDLYEIGDGLTLMNIIVKNDEGKMQPGNEAGTSRIKR